MSDERRRTGRTTRMLEEAERLADQGRAVYVIAANTVHKLALEKILGTGPHGIKVETPDSCGNFDWDTLTLLGAHPNCVVLVDHHAIEVRFSRILEMLHRYDEEPQRETGP